MQQASKSKHSIAYPGIAKGKEEAGTCYAPGSLRNMCQFVAFLCRSKKLAHVTVSVMALHVLAFGLACRGQELAHVTPSALVVRCLATFALLRRDEAGTCYGLGADSAPRP